MKVLVTGINGYIGTILGEELLKRGLDVAGLDTGFFAEGNLYNDVTIVENTIKKDIRDITLEDVEGFDAIIHLAELSNDPLGQINPELTMDVNHKGTVRLATVAKQAGVKRFVYSSSCSVYGASDEVRSEISPVNPLTAYAKAKVLNEEALLKMADATFSPVILRNATVYGASPRMRFDLVVNNLAGLAFTTKQIKMQSDGTPWRPLVHVRDASLAMICSLEAPLEGVHGQIFNVGDTKANYQIKDLAEIVASVFPGCSVSFNKDGADKRNYRVNFDKINSTLVGFKCAYDVKKGSEELKEIFEQIRMSEETFTSRLYTRLKQIEYLRSGNMLEDDLRWSK